MDEKRSDATLTDKELCERLRISRQTLKQHIADNEDYLKKLKHVWIGHSRRWDRDSVEQLFES
jgi:excisionase family DNA binding protein